MSAEADDLQGSEYWCQQLHLLLAAAKLASNWLAEYRLQMVACAVALGMFLAHGAPVIWHLG